jgi:hypothetical protein
MTYVAWMLMAAIAVMLLAPHAPISRWLRRMLVEAPAEWMSRRKRGEMVLWAAFVVFIVVCVWAPDIARAIGFLFAGAAESAPVLAALIDGSVALEVLLAAWFAASSGALKALWRLIRGWADAASTAAVRIFRAVRRQRPRSRRRKRPGGGSPKKPDDSSPEPDWTGWVFA